MTPRYDAVVLAGGRARRLGGVSKPGVVVAGRALLDHVLAAVAGARQVVVVGPPQLARPGVTTVLEDPPDGGPVAGLAAGLAALTGPALPAGSRSGSPAEAADRPADLAATTPLPELVAVLACDVPRAVDAVDALLAVAVGTGADGARLVAPDGSPQHLVAVYRRTALADALAALGSPRGASMRRLVEALRLADVPDTTGAGADADTWQDVRALDTALSGGTIGADGDDTHGDDTLGSVINDGAGHDDRRNA